VNYYFSAPELDVLLLTERKRYLPTGRGTGHKSLKEPS
jgi:hypothetical protein